MVLGLELCVVNLFCKNACLFFCMCVLSEMGKRNKVHKTLNGS